MSDGTRFVFFRSDSMVMLVSHPGQAMFDVHGPAILSDWIKTLAAETLPEAAARLKIGESGPSFTFSAEKYGSAHTSPTMMVTAIRPHAAASDVAHSMLRASAPIADQASLSSKAQSASQQHEDVAPPSFTVVIQGVSGITPAELVLLTRRLAQARAGFNEKNSASNKFAVEQVALNWYNSAGHDGVGSGGPGGRPSEASGLKVDRHDFFLPGEITKSLENKTTAAPVQVAILDTSPLPDEIHKALGNFGQNSLLQAMPGHLAVHIDTANRFPDVPVADHDYNMSDHGLFVAGIVHSIAREAHLHLFQVLGDRGVGDTETISRGLLNVSELIVKDSGSSRWVVNASLMMAAPADQAHFDAMMAVIENQPPDITPEEQREQTELLALLRKFLGDPREAIQDWLISEQSLAVEYMCRYLHFNRNTYVVAAAGNDRKPNDISQPAARYPAKAHGVLGVGALGQDGTDASYSNADDDPLLEGMVTLGGEVPDHGVAGLYIGDFPGPLPVPGVTAPPAPKNNSGWAQWAGTSFATPVITGIIADLLRTGNYANAEDAIKHIRLVMGSAGPRIVVPVTQA